MTRRHPAGFTLIELLMVVAILGILAALATPFLLAARASGNEASAIGSLRAIGSAQANFATSCGSGLYSVNINTLIDRALPVARHGVQSEVGLSTSPWRRASTPSPAPPIAPARSRRPVLRLGQPVASTSGTRAFATNSVGTIWQDSTGVAPPEPFTAGGTVGPIQ